MPAPPLHFVARGQRDEVIRNPRHILFSITLLFFALSACTPPPALPTASSISMQQTAVVLTQNAPPPGFQGTISFPQIDAHLSDQPAWDATVQMAFDGVRADDPPGNQRPATGTLNVQLFHDELTSARRVLFNAEGAAFGLTDARQLEAVRLGNDYYLVTQGVCGKVTDASSRQVADLSAGGLLGGVGHATPTGARQEMNGLPSWEYIFKSDSVSVPLAHLQPNGSVTVAAGSLWVAPSANAVVRFTLTVNVQNVTLLNATQPVTGQLRETYTLGTVGQLHNISIPFGC
ncbi:MAG: hypothetical protein ACYDBJ_06425 [Aggregatilineales bacterium]